MLCMVTGGSGSGKSEYAEKLACEQANKGVSELACEQEYKSGGRLYYVATMKPYVDASGKIDKETADKIFRHQRMRSNKGFTTIEQYHSIGELEFSGDDVVLLECMSNLLANEMYSGDCSVTNIQSAISCIADPLVVLANKVKCLVVVTNEVFSDGRTDDYDESTVAYIKNLAAINMELARHSDLMYEVCCGIPIELKGIN